MFFFFFFFQAEDGIRDLVRSRGLGDVYKRQGWGRRCHNTRCRNTGATTVLPAAHWPASACVHCRPLPAPRLTRLAHVWRACRRGQPPVRSRRPRRAPRGGRMSALIAAQPAGLDTRVAGADLGYIWVVAAIALLALVVAGYLVREVLAAPEGTAKMREIALAVQEGAAAYL